MNTKRLTLLQFNLAYLALLTESGTKPLSRWEGVVPDKIEDVMKEIGLEFAYVCRSLRNGKSTTEFIFSKSEAYLDLYLQHFDGSLIDKSVDTQRIEGFLFGFPPCCVESFAHFGYRPNGLDVGDQKLLFHWACQGCQVTPLLLPSYRRVHQHCVEIFTGRDHPHALVSEKQKEVAKRVLAAVSMLGLVTTGATLYASNSTHSDVPTDGDPHWLPWPAGMDNDGDFLPDDDEPYVGALPNNPDTDGNGVLDGVQLAQAAQAIYAMLPHDVQSNGPYVVDHLVWGSEQCSVCGAMENMGYVEIVNPLENLVIEVPYIALHYLEHGSFQYSGDVHPSGSVHIRKSKAVLEGDGTWHRLGCDHSDMDNDGLYDFDEPYLGTDPTKIDSDSDGIIDGTQLSRACASIVDSLPRVPQVAAPYAEDHMLKGVVTCARCGESVNMGYVRAINPLENQWTDLPYLALHYMHCAGFTFSDGSSQEMIDARVLKAVLESDGTLHRLPIEPDGDSDGLADDVESRFGYLAGNPDSDGDGVPDGVQLARQYWTEIEALPREQSPGTYRVEHEARGVETCEMCGLEMNMGYTEIINPAEQYRVEIPYISLHYLQHGSFAARGSVHCCGQIDPRSLDCVLHADGNMHLLPIASDEDNDGLTSGEEVYFGTQPNQPDTDNDGTRDGVELGRALVAKVDSLPHTPQPNMPYRVDYYANGLELCEICGELLNMGFVLIINPVHGDSLDMPFISLHAMGHAGFAYDGTVHDGRTDPMKLATLLGVPPTSVQSMRGITPAELALWPCFPNPFNASTVIRYDLAAPAFVELRIYNPLGQNVSTVVSERQAAGEHRIHWDGCGEEGLPVPSGVYLVHLQAGNETRVHKVAVVR